MLFLSSLLLSGLALGAPLMARDDQYFGILAIRSGTSLQYSTFSVKDNGLYITGDSSSYFTGILHSDGSVEDSNNLGHYLTVDSKGAYTFGTTKDTEFSVGGADLLYKGKDQAFACPDGSSYQIYFSSDDSSCTGIAPYFAKSTKTASSSSSTPTSTEAPKTTSEAPAATTTTECATTSTSEAPSKASAAAESTKTVLPPNLLVPADESDPDHVYGTQYTATIANKGTDDHVVTWVSFDVPRDSGATSCKFIFDISKAAFPSTLTGAKKFEIVALEEGTSEIDANSLSWNSHPATGPVVGYVDAATGEVTTTSDAVNCNFGGRAQFVLTPPDNDASEVEWFQTWSPPVGLNLVLTA